MVVFEIIHLLAGILGVATGVGLLGPWCGYDRQLVSGMWLSAAIVAGTGVVISLSSVGSGGPSGSGSLLAKVVLTIGLLGGMYVTVGFGDEIDPQENRLPLLGITGLWVVLFGLGVTLVT